jgi:hypothetical protein
LGPRRYEFARAGAGAFRPVAANAASQKPGDLKERKSFTEYYLFKSHQALSNQAGETRLEMEGPD